MLQLNNRITGQVAIADLSIDYRTGIIWDVYSNGLKIFPSIRKSNGVVIDVNKIPDTAMSLEELKELLTYEELLKESDLQGFEISSDLKNWCVPTGSTGKETLIRVYIPSELREKCNESRDNIESIYFPLYELIMKCYQFPAFTYKSGLQYLECFEGEDENILKSFESEGIIIDYKYTQVEGEINLV